MIVLNRIYSFFLEIFFPKRCVNCGKAAKQFVCPECVKKVEKIKTSTCPICGKISQSGRFCKTCHHPYLAGILTSAVYEAGPVKEMIHHLKYTGITELSDSLGELIVERLKYDMPKGHLVIVPIPLHKKREFSRGFNQSELIARYISKRLDIPGGLALSRIKNTKSQVNLPGNLRKSNLLGAFRCEDIELIKNKVVLLVDDVATTSSTLSEGAKVLRENGARRVFGVVAAQKRNY